MKGNEARVVFFLQPVNELKDTQLSSENLKLVNSGFCFRLALVLLLALLFSFAFSVGDPQEFLFYAFAVSSSLLAIDLLAIFLDKMHFRSEMALQWKKMQGLPYEELLLLHTLPYYLAISRSTCEVRNGVF